MNPVESVLQALRGRQAERQEGVIVVAIDGRSGAGKSTLANAIADGLGAAVVHGDDFYRDMPDVDRRALTAAEGVDRYFDWQRLRDEAILPLRDRRAARFQCFDWSVGHGLGELMVVEPCEVVVVEGVYSARPEFEHLIDLKVLVTIPQQQRVLRLDDRAGERDRHAPEAWDARWDAAECVYFETIRPPSDFDLIVDGGRVDVPLGAQTRGALVQALPLLTGGLLLTAALLIWDGAQLAAVTGVAVLAAGSALLRAWLLRRLRTRNSANVDPL